MLCTCTCIVVFCRVLKSIGVFIGFAGCIESLKVDTRKTMEYNLMYPGSPDIEAEDEISEYIYNTIH